MRRGKNRMVSIGFFLMCMLVVWLPVTVSAKEEGTLTIKTVVEKDQGNQFSLPNTKFVLYQVGTYENQEWTLSKAFKDTKVVFDFEDADSQKTTAKKLADYAIEHRKTGTEGITNQEGELVFSKLERGVYLIFQPEKTTLNQEKYQSQPFLITMPINAENEVLWNVTVEPKFKNESIPDIKPTEPSQPGNTPNSNSGTSNVQTGDPTDILSWLLVFAVSFGVVLVLCLHRRKSKGRCAE